MRRTLFLAALTTTALGLFLFLRSPSSAKPGEAEKSSNVEPRGTAAQVPITQVVLFSSGVGYFQREGQIEGNTRIDLTFPVQDINDLLKSMVLEDLGNGHIGAVSYDSQSPVEKTLRSFAINLTGNPTFGQILNQARGEKVEAVLQQSATQPASLTGVIVGVERKKETVGKDVIEGEFINLWCAEGMRSVRLSDVQRVRFLNPVLDTEVKKALEALALAHDTQKKAVSINCVGDGKRSVKVGYVVENPIWKTSYRLVLKDKGKPYLQGWAVVENTQDEDWNNVRMALISGRPISFQMDLYQPLFVKRPVVEPELFASLRPPTYTGAMEQWGQLPEKRKQLRSEEKVEVEHLMKSLDKAVQDQKIARSKVEETIDAQKSVSSAASATELGDYFQYAIEQPVSLARQKSAMLPIVTSDVDASRVSIYNQATHAKFPLLGLKFKNTTNLHLMQGPITVFDGASYAGDARILDLQPKEERLISYAIDLGTEVEPVQADSVNRLIQVKVNKGIIHATHKVRESWTFNVKNRSEHDRLLIIEHPYRADFKLIAPDKASERARDVYRFELAVAAGKTAKLDVIEEHDVLEEIALSNTNDDRIRIFLSGQVASTKVKEALRKTGELKDRLSATQRELEQLNRALQEIGKDQERLRANLKEMPPTAAAYKRYLEKFDKQETEIEQIQTNVKGLQATELQQRKELDNYLANLTIE